MTDCISGPRVIDKTRSNRLFRAFNHFWKWLVCILMIAPWNESNPFPWQFSFLLPPPIGWDGWVSYNSFLWVWRHCFGILLRLEKNKAKDMHFYIQLKRQKAPKEKSRSKEAALTRALQACQAVSLGHLKLSPELSRTMDHWLCTPENYPEVHSLKWLTLQQSAASAQKWRNEKCSPRHLALASRLSSLII